MPSEQVQERNPGFTEEDYAAVFREYFGVTISLAEEGIVVTTRTAMWTPHALCEPSTL